MWTLVGVICGYVIGHIVGYVFGRRKRKFRTKIIDDTWGGGLHTPR